MATVSPRQRTCNIQKTPEWALYYANLGQKDHALEQIYDPTNGTVSAGGIIRYVGNTQGLMPTSGK